jgi:ABC-type uncharacterized transport system permease subunit
MNAIEFIISGMLAAATPFLLAALGELVVERAGVLNLGVEGLMAFGAVLAFIIVYHGGGHFLSFVVAGLGSAALSLIFAIVALGFRANQVATGLAIGILGQGLSALFGKTYESLTVKALPKLAFPWLSEIPVVGGLFTQDIVVWISLAATLGIWAIFTYTKLGLVIRAVGENPKAAHAIGYSVMTVRVVAIAFGGAMAGFAGAYAAVIYTPLWGRRDDRRARLDCHRPRGVRHLAHRTHLPRRLPFRCRLANGARSPSDGNGRSLTIAVEPALSRHDHSARHHLGGPSPPEAKRRRLAGRTFRTLNRKSDEHAHKEDRGRSAAATPGNGKYRRATRR